MHIFWARLASFCHLCFISDPLIVSKFHNETDDPKGQENKIYTIVKGRETFYRRTQSKSPAVVKSNMFLKDRKFVFKTNYRLMQGQKIAEFIKLQCFIKIFVLSIFSDRLHKFYCNQHSLPQRDDCKTRMTLNTARQSKDHTQKNTKNWTNNKQLTITN